MSISFRDMSHLTAYCKGHFTQTQGNTGMDFVTEMKIVGVVVAIAAAWYLGKEGFAGLSSIYAGIRNLFSGTKTTTTPAATVPAATPVA